MKGDENNKVDTDKLKNKKKCFKCILLFIIVILILLLSLFIDKIFFNSTNKQNPKNFTSNTSSSSNLTEGESASLSTSQISSNVVEKESTSQINSNCIDLSSLNLNDSYITENSKGYSFKEVEKLTSYKMERDYYGYIVSINYENGVFNINTSSACCNNSEYCSSLEDYKCITNNYNDTNVNYIQVMGGCLDVEDYILVATDTYYKYYSTGSYGFDVEYYDISENIEGMYTYDSAYCGVRPFLNFNNEYYKNLYMNTVIKKNDADKMIFLFRLCICFK